MKGKNRYKLKPFRMEVVAWRLVNGGGDPGRWYYPRCLVLSDSVDDH